MSAMRTTLPPCRRAGGTGDERPVAVAPRAPDPGPFQDTPSGPVDERGRWTVDHDGTARAGCKERTSHFRRRSRWRSGEPGQLIETAGGDALVRCAMAAQRDAPP